MLQDLRGTAIIPALCEWVRIGKPLEDERLVETYIPRADAQRLALALLKIPWHPEGYLLGANKSDQCFQWLLESSLELYSLLVSVDAGIGSLGLSTAHRRQLSSELNSLLQRFHRSRIPLRSTCYAMFRLERTLMTISHTNQQVNEMIGTITITNPEFLRLMVRTARRSQQAPDAEVRIDMRSGMLQVPAEFGVILEFPLEIQELYPQNATSDEVIPVRYSLVLIVALRACLRSDMLRNCFDSHPLLRQVSGLEDVIQIS